MAHRGRSPARLARKAAAALLLTAAALASLVAAASASAAVEEPPPQRQRQNRRRRPARRKLKGATATILPASGSNVGGGGRGRRRTAGDGLTNLDVRIVVTSDATKETEKKKDDDEESREEGCQVLDESYSPDMLDKFWDAGPDNVCSGGDGQQCAVGTCQKKCTTAAAVEAWNEEHGDGLCIQGYPDDHPDLNGFGCRCVEGMCRWTKRCDGDDEEGGTAPPAVGKILDWQSQEVEVEAQGDVEGNGGGAPCEPQVLDPSSYPHYDRFEGTSFPWAGPACADDGDCDAGGCSGDVCAPRGALDGWMFTCDWPDHHPKEGGYECGCVGGECLWNRGCP